MPQLLALSNHLRYKSLIPISPGACVQDTVSELLPLEAGFR